MRTAQRHTTTGDAWAHIARKLHRKTYQVMAPGAAGHQLELLKIMVGFLGIEPRLRFPSRIKSPVHNHSAKNPYYLELKQNMVVRVGFEPTTLGV